MRVYKAVLRKENTNENTTMGLSFFVFLFFFFFCYETMGLSWRYILGVPTCSIRFVFIFTVKFVLFYFKLRKSSSLLTELYSLCQKP